MSGDDNCPDKTNPYGCGGWQAPTREVITPPNALGYMGIANSRKKECNQIKCPIVCAESKWSGFSACSKDGEGGSQSHSRSVLVQPLNGGMACNTVQG